MDKKKMRKKGTQWAKRLLAAVCTAALVLGLMPVNLGTMGRVYAADFDLGSWRNTWSGKSLGTEITAAQLEEIYNGTLTTIGLGDYWTIGGTVYRVADYDYYYGQNDCTDHDLILVPDTALKTMPMNTSDTNAKGYYGSAGRATLQSTIKEALPADIKNNLLTHSMYMSTATNETTYENTWELKESNGIELMSVAQVFGNDDNIAIATGNNNWKEAGYSSYSTDTQISLFKFASDGTLLDTADCKTTKANNIFKANKYWWLASTVESNKFVRVCSISDIGRSDNLIPGITASANDSVRPAIVIKGACNHTYGEPSYKWASDYSRVTATRICTKCSEQEKEGVKTTSKVTQQADCTKPELTTYTATFTNTAFSTQKKENVQTKAALGHTAVHHEAVAATCTEDGNIEYWTCSRCNKYFSDATCTTETTAETVQVIAAGHNLVHHDAVAATTTETGTKEYWQCSVCGKYFSDAEGENKIDAPETIPVIKPDTPVQHTHTLVYHAEVAATTIKAGTKAYWQCSDCGKYFSDAEGKTEIEKPEIIPIIAAKDDGSDKGSDNGSDGKDATTTTTTTETATTETTAADTTGTTAGGSAAANTAAASDSPKTGDSTPIAWLFALMLVCGCGAYMMIEYRKSGRND